MSFSGGVKLGDLDDFISAAQDCVKPLIQAAGGGGSAKLDGTAEGLRGMVPRVGTSPAVAPSVEVPQVQRPNLIKTKKSANNPKAEIGQVTLSDCLACSGCVTSAETVLLQAQSGEEFLRRAGEAPLTVVTISPEARTSLAMYCGASPLLTLQRLAGVLHRLGADYILDNSAAEAMALLEGKVEFVRRFREENPAVAGARLPLLTSHCPGWTCYAEKVVDPAVLPHLFPVRPPQQIQGRLVKTVLLEAHNQRRFHRWWRSRSPLFAAESAWWVKSVVPKGDSVGSTCKPLTPADVYHVTVQPCFDRKIEAARPQFEVEQGVREVDTVLTATELLELAFQDLGAAGVGADEGAAVLATAPPWPLDSEVLTDVLLGDLRSGRPPGRPLLCAVPGNAESGGFIEFVFREAARELFQVHVAAPVCFVVKQNEDMREVVLKDKQDRVLLRFVAAYGFRNIQNVIKKVVKASEGNGLDCGHFVEIMACPGGCLNGGGQVPAPKAGASKAKADSRQRLAQMEALLRDGPDTAFVPPEQHPLVLPLYRHIAAARAAREGDKRAEPEASLGALVGSEVVREWLAAEWRSLKVDAEGNAVIGTSALKW